mmetsp:Transcript_10876/g.27016  ORF Transcript_10876/g.27016 Transcript_10876/m.27016 type:complete len:383 (+) Transcript_10876:294-1442(+)
MYAPRCDELDSITMDSKQQCDAGRFRRGAGVRSKRARPSWSLCTRQAPQTLLRLHVARLACLRPPRLLVLPLEVHDGLGSNLSNRLLRGLGDVVVLALSSCSDLLSDARRDELVLGVKHQHLEVGQGAQHFRGLEHLFLQLILPHRRCVRVALSNTHRERHVRAAIRNADDEHLAYVARLLRRQAHLGGLVECVREGRAAAARHPLQSVFGHRDRARGREQHLRELALEGDERDLVAALVRLGEQVDRRALSRVHAVERHRSRGVDHEDDERSCLARHLLGAHVGRLDEDSLLHELGVAARQRTLAPLRLVRRGGAHGRVDSQLAHLAFGQDRLDVPAALLREDHAARARAASLRLVGELHHLRVERDALHVEHELLGHWRR